MSCSCSCCLHHRTDQSWRFGMAKAQTCGDGTWVHGSSPQAPLSKTSGLNTLILSQRQDCCEHVRDSWGRMEGGEEQHIDILPPASVGSRLRCCLFVHLSAVINFLGRQGQPAATELSVPRLQLFDNLPAGEAFVPTSSLFWSFTLSLDKYDMMLRFTQTCTLETSLQLLLS